MKTKEWKLIILCITICVLLCACGSDEKKTDSSISTDNNTNNISENKIDYQSKLAAKAFYGDIETKADWMGDSEIELWNSRNAGDVNEPNGQEKIQLNFLGKTIEGTYKATYVAFWQLENYRRMKYDVSYGKFEVNEKTGEIVRFIGRIPVFDNAFTKEDARAKFEEMADENITKDEYELVEEKPDDNSYGFSYFRTIKDIPTSENFSVLFMNDGTCVAYNNIMTDEFDEFFEKYSEEEINEMTGALCSEHAAEVLEEKIANIFSKYEYDSYEIENEVFTLLEDGSLALVHQIKVNFESGKGPDGHREEKLNVAVCLNE